MKIDDLDQIENLRVFAVFARSKNMIEAATHLKISQPTVSVRLKTLESKMPFPLFETRGKKKVLTRYGVSLLEAIAPRMEEIPKAMTQWIQMHERPENQSVTIGVRKELFSRVLENIRFASRVKLADMSNDQIIQGLLGGSIDIGITHHRPDVHLLTSRPFFKTSVALCCHRSLLNERKLTSKIASGRDFITGLPSIAYKTEAPFLKEWCTSNGCTTEDLDVRVTCEDWPAIANLVSKGVGFSILPDEYTNFEHSDVDVLRVPHEIVPEITFYLLFSKSSFVKKRVDALFGLKGRSAR